MRFYWVFEGLTALRLPRGFAWPAKRCGIIVALGFYPRPFGNDAIGGSFQAQRAMPRSRHAGPASGIAGKIKAVRMAPMVIADLFFFDLHQPADLAISLLLGALRLANPIHHCEKNPALC
jgi:hypothetical protein